MPCIPERRCAGALDARGRCAGEAAVRCGLFRFHRQPTVRRGAWILPRSPLFRGSMLGCWSNGHQPGPVSMPLSIAHITRTARSRLIDCRRRKPAPGMISDLLKTWPVDEVASFTIGDRDTDIAAARLPGLLGPYRCGAGQPRRWWLSSSSQENCSAQPLSAQGPTGGASQVRAGPGFVDQDEPGRIECNFYSFVSEWITPMISCGTAPQRPHPACCRSDSRRAGWRRIPPGRRSPRPCRHGRATTRSSSLPSGSRRQTCSSPASC